MLRSMQVQDNLYTTIHSFNFISRTSKQKLASSYPINFGPALNLHYLESNLVFKLSFQQHHVEYSSFSFLQWGPYSDHIESDVFPCFKNQRLDPQHNWYGQQESKLKVRNLTENERKVQEV